MTNTPSLAVVVCVHNAPDYTSICIDSVLRHTPKPYELIIVNDGSAQETTDMLNAYPKRYAHAKVIHHETAKGYTGAANAGLKASSADYTILLNSDTVVSPHWSEKIIACAKSDERIGIAGPLSNAATYQSLPFVFDERGHWKQNELPDGVTVSSYARAIADASAHTYPRTPVANGFCFCVKRAVIDRIGYLDEETFPRGYGEENDYCLRAADAGFEIAIVDDAYVYHATSKSFGVKQREALTRNAHFAIRSKYSQARLDGIDKALRNHPQMDAVRERIIKRLHMPDALQQHHANLPILQQRASDLSILFLLPDCSAKAGGSQVIVETARGLERLGIKARIAMKEHSREEYENFFPADANLFWYYKKDNELIRFAGDYQIAIATIFHSIRQLKAITSKHAHVKPAYYVQDYEPLFLDGHPDLEQLAKESYTMLPECQLFGISPWVCDVIQEKHGKPVAKILGSLDQSLFFPSYAERDANAPLIISCMIRPSTAWRSPKRSMRVLKQLKQAYGDAVEIRTFGCRLDEIESGAFEHDFNFHHYGIIGRHDVAALLRSSDIFLDASEFQAFGRTALEAMACGCAVVAPEKGGVHDFGEHEKNVLLVDTASDEPCLHACRQLIDDAHLRQTLAESAIQTGLNYSIHRSTLSFLALMEQIAKGGKRKQPRCGLGNAFG